MSRVRRRFSREFKVSAVEQMLEAPDVTALALQLGVRRKMLYRWRSELRAGGAVAAIAVPVAQAVLETELRMARARIADLERKVGQQALDLDFMRLALQPPAAASEASAQPGAVPSTPSSGR